MAEDAQPPGVSHYGLQVTVVLVGATTSGPVIGGGPASPNGWRVVFAAMAVPSMFLLVARGALVAAIYLVNRTPLVVPDLERWVENEVEPVLPSPPTSERVAR
jgi:MFS family permease